MRGRPSRRGAPAAAVLAVGHHLEVQVVSNSATVGVIAVAGMARKDDGRRGVRLVEVALQKGRERVRVGHHGRVLLLLGRCELAEVERSTGHCCRRRCAELVGQPAGIEPFGSVLHLRGGRSGGHDLLVEQVDVVQVRMDDEGIRCPNDRASDRAREEASTAAAAYKVDMVV
jgi:hypothetical protein